MGSFVPPFATDVPVENRPDGVETANASTRFSATGGADLKRNGYARNFETQYTLRNYVHQ